MSTLALAKRLLRAVASGSTGEAASIINLATPLVTGVASLLFPEERPNIGGIELNCTLSEEHGFFFEVTRVPVETGSDLTDHIQKEPIMLTMVGVISPRPDNILDQFRNLTGFGGQPGGGRKYNAEDRANSSWARLNLLADSKTPFQVSTALRLYNNMVFESLNTTETAEDALIFTAVFVEIHEVDIRKGRYLADNFQNDGAATDNFSQPTSTAVGDVNVQGSPGVRALTIVA